ncbi:hypothetical protein AB0F46_21515 [Streptomyces sp. NPDC026665]|uniref:hypothetical protein n=1 Tax=Streptomyces sp. NPDC026665 TaxID=3154798 RepID=UPI0033EE6933
MPQITLAAWHDGRAPGTELVVTEDELRDLVRDGRVASITEVVGAVSHGVSDVQAADSAEPEAAAEPGASEPVAQEDEADAAAAPGPRARRRR